MEERKLNFEQIVRMMERERFFNARENHTLIKHEKC